MDGALEIIIDDNKGKRLIINRRNVQKQKSKDFAHSLSINFAFLPSVKKNSINSKILFSYIRDMP